MFSHKKNYSLFAQTKKILLLIYGLFLISFTVIFLFLNINMRSNLYDTHHKAINYCLSEIENNLKIASRSVLSALYNDPDLSELSCSDNKLADLDDGYGCGLGIASCLC